MSRLHSNNECLNWFFLLEIRQGPTHTDIDRHAQSPSTMRTQLRDFCWRMLRKALAEEWYSDLPVGEGCYSVSGSPPIIDDSDIYRWSQLYRTTFGPNDPALSDMVRRASWLANAQPKAMAWVWQWRHTLTRDLSVIYLEVAERKFKTMWVLWRALLFDFVNHGARHIQEHQQSRLFYVERQICHLFLRGHHSWNTMVLRHVHVRKSMWLAYVVAPHGYELTSV